MISARREVQLKNGGTCTLRSAEISDAPAMLKLMRSTVAETQFLMRYPEECVMTLQEEEAFVKAAAESDSRLMLLAFADGDLIGSCMLLINSFIKTRHRATLGVAVLESHWGRGVGTALMQAVEKAARARGVKLLELEFIEGNLRGQRLYERLGFRTVGEHPNAVRLKDGTMLKEYLMAKDLTV